MGFSSSALSFGCTHVGPIGLVGLVGLAGLVGLVGLGPALACSGASAESETQAASYDSDTSPTGITAGDGSDGSSSDGVECPARLIDCGGACIDPEHDPEHCGGCDKTCAQGLACIDGLCGSACGEGVESCAGQCVDLNVDPAHCGVCDNVCASDRSCIAGQCTPECAQGEKLCALTCTDTSDDEENCGDCGNRCQDEQFCAFGQCIDTTINYVLIGGQSLSVGGLSDAISTEQPFDNLMLNTGVRAGSDALTSFVPLVEAQQGIYGETIASGLANLVAELELAEGRPSVIAASAHGVGGYHYQALKKGTASFTEGMTQVEAATQIASELGETLAVRAVALIHGENDHILGNYAYDQNILEWQADYEADITSITEQVHPVPLFLCQMSSWTAFNSATSPIPGAQLAAADARPDRIFVVGPKYFLSYVPDGIHLSGHGERWLGEFYAKAYRRVLIDGEPWIPLRPRTISRDDAVLTVDFDVPAPPLVFDTERVSDPGNFGFEFWDSSGAPPAIVSVELTGDTQVQVTLSAAPTAGNKRLRYAYTGIPGQKAGPTTGARGNLRDSDQTPSRHDYQLANWALHFDIPVD